jgi:4-hydroxymandelate oxidase
MVDHLTPLASIPPDVRTLADYERRAPAHLTADVWAHIQDVAGTGLSAQDNRAAFDRWRLMPRALADLVGGTTAFDLFGERHAAPVLVAPLAYGRIAHPEGERAIIRAATAIGIGYILSTLSSVTLEEIAEARLAGEAQLGSAAPFWFQLYLQPRREDSLALVRRAEAAGYRAIVLTIDAGVKPSGFILPPGVEAANLRGMPRAQHVAAAGGRIIFGTALADAAPSWDDLAWLREVTQLPLLLKGMMAPGDAQRMVAAGVDGLIVSNHGGRVLDGLPAALDQLREIVAAVGDTPVLIDGGVRCGTDVVKALCLGARAVLVGRPVLHALAVAGLPGAAHALHLLRTEVEVAMAQLGCATIADLTLEGLVPPIGRT